MSIDKITNSPNETMNYAESIISSFEPGDIYGLRGEMASGKTTFIKGLLMGMGYKEMVNSPTFTLINEYDAVHKVIHIDCYRENNINRWVDLGIFEYFSSDAIVLIEWPEIISDILPKTIKYIDFEVLENNGRKIKII
tara:strand:+ start:623 stop:1036 length:414 start_codon:yes stop_codon:yes gene_type:complete